eukprot:9489807-Pyramimonas_sp.AAC.1
MTYSLTQTCRNNNKLSNKNEQTSTSSLNRRSPESPDKTTVDSLAFRLTEVNSVQLGEQYTRWAQAADHTLAILCNREDQVKKGSRTASQVPLGPSSPSTRAARAGARTSQA